MEKKPSFMQGNDSVGYLIECEEYRKNIKAGDTVTFYLTLFGNNIVYFGQYVQAFSQLGMYGIGKNKSRYIIWEIKNIDFVLVMVSIQMVKENILIKLLLVHLKEKQKKNLQNLSLQLKAVAHILLKK